MSNELEYGRPPQPRQSWLTPIAIGVLLLSLGAIGILLLSMQQSPPPPPPSKPGAPAGISLTPKFDADHLFSARIDPLLRTLEARDADSARRALAIIRIHFRQARNGAPEFAESIIGPLDSFKTLYLASKGATQRWWRVDPKIQPVANHIRWNYEKHITSGPRIQAAITSALQKLDGDLQANRNAALQEIASTLKSAELQDVIVVDQQALSEFCQAEFDAVMAEFHNAHVGEKAAVGSASAFIAGSVATIVVERAIIFVVARATVSAGGAVAGGAGGGAAAGSIVPGAGTVIGAAAGILAGFAVDTWISTKTKEKTIDQVNRSLDEIENAILFGEKGQDGIAKLFSAAAKRQSESLRTKLHRQIEEAAK